MRKDGAVSNAEQPIAKSGDDDHSDAGIRAGAGKMRISDELWRSYAENKSVELRNAILAAYLDIVKITAGRMYNTYKNHAEQDDMISCGVLALMDAIDGFDYRRGIKFETYASLRVRGSIIDYLRKQDWVPRSIRKAARSIEDTYALMQAEKGSSPSDEELAGRLGMSMEEYYRVLGESSSFNVMSFEELIYEVQTVEDSAGGTPEKSLQQKELRQVLAQSIDRLSEKERLVVTLYYFEGLKSKEVAGILEVSESRVSQIHSKALIKLKADLKQYML